MELAEKGDSNNVDTIMSDFKHDTPVPNFYSVVDDNGVAYNLGKVHNGKQKGTLTLGYLVWNWEKATVPVIS